METIDDVIQKLECIMESDPRTFSNPDCEYGWMFHRINEAIKMLKEIEKDLPSAEPEQNKMDYISFEETKEILKKSIDETTNINEALEKTVQSIYLKGYEDGSSCHE